MRSMVVRIALLCGFITSGCSPAAFPYFQHPPTEATKPEQPLRQTIEEKALVWAVNLCRRFGHQQDTEQFTKCAEHRYDQYIMENRR